MASDDNNLYRAMGAVLRAANRTLSEDFRLQVADEVERLRERAENAESDRNAFRERFKEQSAMAERAEAALVKIRALYRNFDDGLIDEVDLIADIQVIVGRRYEDDQ